jgi:protein SERAC1
LVDCGRDIRIKYSTVGSTGGDRAKTWTWQGNGREVFWPKDLLPQACPTARILSFGYNADFAHFYPFYGPKRVAEELTIDDHSTALFQSIVGLREKTHTVGIFYSSEI